MDCVEGVWQFEEMYGDDAVITSYDQYMRIYNMPCHQVLNGEYQEGNERVLLNSLAVIGAVLVLLIVAIGVCLLARKKKLKEQTEDIEKDEMMGDQQDGLQTLTAIELEEE